MFKYSGFTVDQMLSALSRYCKSVQLELLKNDLWALDIENQDGEKYQNIDGLTRVVSGAFRPFLDRAVNDRAAAQKLFDTVTHED
ncbi:MAG: hypothetical protein HRT35_00855 [Algicola sp.]|nr:hypothetical protein [Algicola sp.]